MYNFSIGLNVYYNFEMIIFQRLVFLRNYLLFPSKCMKEDIFDRNIFQKCSSVKFEQGVSPERILDWGPVKFYLACLQTTPGTFALAYNPSLDALEPYWETLATLFPPTKHPGMQATHPPIPSCVSFLTTHIRTLFHLRSNENLHISHLGDFWDSWGFSCFIPILRQIVTSLRALGCILT